MNTNEPNLVLRGRVATGLSYRGERDGRASFVSFRLAVTPSRRGADNAWSDGVTQWYTVKAWRATADNAARSLRKGDPVVVSGRLSAQEWTAADGTAMTDLAIAAETLGHDLRYGQTHFTRPVADASPTDVTVLVEAPEAGPVGREDSPEPEPMGPDQASEIEEYPVALAG
ncbi:MAG: single-stranded DNA-binding protein [Actinobacteria bacterium]|nr:single-stranded DNA-binding protein [Actinomycetota bacterium]MBU4335387.1 single-stranded DNA-binding protein [Actinomycetota bacterium]